MQEIFLTINFSKKYININFIHAIIFRNFAVHLKIK